MPRFNLTDSVPFGSPSIAPTPEEASPLPTSVRLSCSSPGGRAVHSLSATSSGAYYIETRSLPLIEMIERNDIDQGERGPPIIRTRLPEKITSALSRYPAIELLCVGVESSINESKESFSTLPSLCLYTQKDVFLIDIKYEATAATEAEGIVSNIIEPYEEYLLGNTTSKIIRIRQAPQQFNGYTTICPVGAVSMLTQNLSTGQYCLCIYHGSIRSTSLTFHHLQMENLAELNERISDFCFCKSKELPLLSSLTVAFLKKSGEVYFATPIVFHGTVVPSQTVKRSLDFLESSLKESDSNTAASRQLRAAKQFFIDAFPMNGTTGFVTIGQDGSSTSSRVLHWPVQMQGPVLLPPLLEESSNKDYHDDYQMLESAESIEPFTTEGDLVGFCIGHLAKMVDFAVVSPSAFVPRFEFELSNDAYELDQDLSMGHIVNRVELGSSNSREEDSIPKAIKLLTDPMLDDVIHYVTPSQICSISTNTCKIASNKIRENNSTYLIGQVGVGTNIVSPIPRTKTSAWKCLDVSFFQDRQISIVGAVISDDVELGHTLVVRYSNGKITATNLTETRTMCELDNFSSPEQTLAIQNSLTTGTAEATDVDQTEALSDIVKPLMKSVIDGIGALAQVGGTSTSQDELSPDILAGFVGIESKCKKDIYLPLLTMNEHVTARKVEFGAMNVRRKEQFEVLKELINILREKQDIIKEKTEILLENSKSLADRSTSVLRSSKDLFPTITQAEYDYFQELKRLDDKTKIWKSQVEILSRRILSLNDSSVGVNGELSNLEPNELQSAGKILNASSFILKACNTKIELAGENLEGLASTVGI